MFGFWVSDETHKVIVGAQNYKHNSFNGYVNCFTFIYF